MNANEIWNKTIRMEKADRLLFWPKLSQANLNQWGGEYGFETLEEFFSYVGGDRLNSTKPSYREIHRKCSVEVRERNGDILTQISTPLGDLSETLIYDRRSVSHHPTEFLIKSRRDLEAYQFYFDDMAIEPDEKALESNEEEYKKANGDLFAWEYLGESPLMDFVENRAGVANAHLMLFDFPDEVGNLFESWHNTLKAKTQLCCQYSHADILQFTENTSTTLISPDQYRDYCLRHIGEYDNICRDNDRVLALHMCGHLKDILPDLKRVGPAVFEAFTSPPVGNTPLPLGREELPHVCLIGGTNACLWMEDASVIISQIEKDLKALPHHRGIVISSAGVMPPGADPDKIRQVAEFVKSYPARW